jgi:hypothetical protein
MNKRKRRAALTVGQASGQTRLVHDLLHPAQRAVAAAQKRGDTVRSARSHVDVQAVGTYGDRGCCKQVGQ